MYRLTAGVLVFFSMQCSMVLCRSQATTSALFADKSPTDLFISHQFSLVCSCSLCVYNHTVLRVKSFVWLEQNYYRVILSHQNKFLISAFRFLICSHRQDWLLVSDVQNPKSVLMKAADQQLCYCKKITVAHTQLPSIGFRSWSWFLAVSLQVMWGLLPVSLLGEQRHDGCEHFALDLPTASRLRFEPRPYCQVDVTL